MLIGELMLYMKILLMSCAESCETSKKYITINGGEIMGKTSSAVKNRYNAKVYDRVILAIPKGLKAEWQTKAEENGESLTRYIMNAVEALNK
jgi:hypothetical protein